MRNASVAVMACTLVIPTLVKAFNPLKNYEYIDELKRGIAAYRGSNRRRVHSVRVERITRYAAAHWHAPQIGFSGKQLLLALCFRVRVQHLHCRRAHFGSVRKIDGNRDT